MRNCLLFSLLSLLAIAASLVSNSWIVQLCLAATALALCIVAIAYGFDRPHMLFKRADGRRAVWGYLLLWPYFLLAWLSFWIHVALSRSDASTEIAPGIWLSRRLLSQEVRKGTEEWSAVLDFATEFRRIALPRSAEYCSIPVLDGTPPTIAQLQAAVAWINAHRSRGPVLVHCALGHGRSACAVIAWLVAEKQTEDVESALRLVKSLRPGVGLHPTQVRRLEEFAAC